LDADALVVRLREQQQARIEADLRRAAERAAKVAEAAASEAAEKKKTGKRTVTAPKKKKKPAPKKDDEVDNVVPPLDEARTISQLNLADGAVIFYIFHVDMEAELEDLSWENIDVPVLHPAAATSSI
jgi:hypothetical protein